MEVICAWLAMADIGQAVARTDFAATNVWKRWMILTALAVIGLLVSIDEVQSLSRCEGTKFLKVCGEGDCVNGTCVCFPGWGGEFCQHCDRRISLDQAEGIIYEGSGRYPKNNKCSWLLDTHEDSGNISVRFLFTEFETECGWDHLYIHDGGSAFSPLLAAFSGPLVSGDESMEFNVRLSGRYGFIHFYTDTTNTMDGFNITYSVGGCYLNCSEHGSCVNGLCQCSAGWSGSGCEINLNECLSNCSYNGNCANGICVCEQDYRGLDCSLTKSEILWERVSTKNTPSGRASHVALLQDDVMWSIGGYSLSESQHNTLMVYNISQSEWSEVLETGSSADQPWPLYAHSAVMFENKLYVHGGMRNEIETDELWVFDIASSNWTQLPSSGYPVAGHSAHVVNRTMLVFFGYSPVFGYMNLVRQYDFDAGKWSTVKTGGSIVQGGYGHASTYDVDNGKIYIYGGYHSHYDTSSVSSSTYNLTDMLYAFDVFTKEWMVLLSSGHPRYLHAMVVLGDYLLVFGGNTHNYTSKSHDTKCLSNDFMLYDIKCNSWHSMTSPTLENSARYGHSMLTFDGDLYVFGGFNSLMLNDILRVDLGDCGSIKNESECQTAVPGMRCVWDNSTCRERSSNIVAKDVCDPATSNWDVCAGYNTCSACHLSTTCAWCKNRCTSQTCASPSKVDNSTTNCDASEVKRAACKVYHTCQACQDDSLCMWDHTRCLPRTGAAASDVANKTERQAVCVKKPCATHTSCSSCTQSSCMWCGNLALCISTNAYVASFPYRQCMDWTARYSKCNATVCSGLKSCKACLANPRCGWCNGESDNGLGTCMNGGIRGSIQSPADPTVSSADSGQTSGQCPADRWFFTTCPLCQCNGHATCAANSSVCGSCSFPTRGDQCQYCSHFYYGSPLNGGNCSECFCNGQANACHHLDGQCFCHTRGVTGKQCEKCDDGQKYFGDPKNGGTCFYRLSTDYQYIFNLSKKDDANYTRINFLSIPGSEDRDVDFTLNCSSLALLNITFKSKNQAEEQVVVSGHDCDYYRTKFEHKDYAFGGDSNSTFFVYVYGFQTPFWVQISFAQPRQLDLLVFFIVFFGCFLSLLLIAAALWKIKHKYDSYRRRQQMIVEMQQMASRPFSSVCVDVEKKGEQTARAGTSERKELRDHVDSALRRRKKLANKPSAVAIEPLTGNKAAVLTLLVQLPFGDAEYAPSGQSGMAVASALVSLGTTRKQSLEHIKGDKPRIRKNLLCTHPDALA